MINQLEMPAYLNNFTCPVPQNLFYSFDLQFDQIYQEIIKEEIYEEMVDYPPLNIEPTKVLNKDNTNNLENGEAFACLDFGQKRKETSDTQITISDVKSTHVCHTNSLPQVRIPAQSNPVDCLLQQKVASETERTTFTQVGNVDVTPPLAESNIIEKTRIKKAKEKIDKMPKIKKIKKEKFQQKKISTEEGSQNQCSVTQKNEQRRNMYGYSFKHIIRELFSDRYKEFLAKLCIKHGVSDPDDIVSFYRGKLLWSISLSNVLTLLDFSAHPVHSSGHKVIKAFHSFYVWYMRKRYVIHILNSTEIEHKEEYIEATRSLIYLPRIRQLKLKQATHSTSEF